MNQGLLYAIRGGAFLLLLMPFVVSAGPLPDAYFPFIVGKALYARSLIEVMFALWVVLALRSPDYRPPRSWILLGFIIFVGVSLLAGVWGVSLQRSLWSTYERMQGIVDLVHWFALAVVLTSVFRSLAQWRWLLSFNVGASLAMSLLGFAQRYDVSVPGYGFLENTQRVDITLGNPTYVGAYMMVNILVALALLSQSYQTQPVATGTRAARRRRGRRRRTEEHSSTIVWWRIFWITAIVLGLWVLIMSGTRGAVLGLAVGLVAFSLGYAIWGHIRPARLAGYAVIGVIVLLALALTLGRDTAVVERVADSNSLVERITQVRLDDGSVKGRLESLRAGMEGFGARPILGWGPENFLVAWGRYFDKESGVTERFDQAHNKLVEELTTKGFVGLVSYLALWVLMFKVLIDRLNRRDPEQEMFFLFIAAALIGYFVQNLFLFDTPGTLLQFMLLLAFLAAMERPRPEPEGEGAGPGRPVPEGEEGRESPVQQDWLGRAATRLEGSLRSLTESGPVRRLRRAPVFGPEPLSMYALATALVLAALLIFFGNYRPYSAANALVSTRDGSITWEERFDLFDESIDAFPQLANYSRLEMLSQLTTNWGSLTDPQVERALRMIEREAQRAAESEPEGWRFIVALTQLYQVASLRDPAILPQAKSHLAVAEALAPETLEVDILRLRQRAIENQ